MHRRTRPPRQLCLPTPRTWGGARKGAGRKSARARPGVRHVTRPVHDPLQPAHITLRARAGLPSLRSPVIFPILRRALTASSRRGLRLLHFSVQSDHVHLIIEVDTAPALTRGVQGMAIRCARAINRAAQRRGPVWDGRYHAHALETPRETRQAISYVLMNFKKHQRGDRRLFDPCSSAAWFDGFRPARPTSCDPPPIRQARTWLASTAWRRHGLIGWDEAPKVRPMRGDSAAKLIRQ